MRDIEKELSVDLPLAKAYYSASQKISDFIGKQNDLEVSSIMRMPDVISQFANEIDEQEIAKIITKNK